MDLFPNADQLIRCKIPQVLDVIGLSSQASALRALEAGDFGSASRVLYEISCERIDIRPELWTDFIGEAAFWAEVAMWAAVDSDEVTFRYAIDRVDRVIELGWLAALPH